MLTEPAAKLLITVCRVRLDFGVLARVDSGVLIGLLVGLGLRQMLMRQVPKIRRGITTSMETRSTSMILFIFSVFKAGKVFLSLTK